MNSTIMTCAMVQQCFNDKPPFVYLAWYYCCSHAFLFFIACLTFFFFLMLATGASEYFCPNLSYMSNFLELSETVSGVTLAALGNGAPDLFTTFLAIKSDSAGLALGELLGAAAFISMFVVGSVSLTSSFKLPRRPFIRDVFAFIGAVTWVLIVLSDGEISFFEALGMIVYYTIYVLIVVIGHFLYRRKCKTAEYINNIQVEVDLPTVDLIDDHLVDRISSSPTEETPLLPSSTKIPYSNSTPIPLHINISRSMPSPSSFPSSKRSPILKTGLNSSYFNTFQEEWLEDSNNAQHHHTPLFLAPQIDTSPQSRSCSSGPILQRLYGVPTVVMRANAIESVGLSTTPPFTNHDLGDVEEWPIVFRSLANHLMPIFGSWRTLSLLGRCIGVVMVPVFLAFETTVPVAEFVNKVVDADNAGDIEGDDLERHDGRHRILIGGGKVLEQKVLLTLQFFVSPWVFSLIIFEDLGMLIWNVPVYILTLSISCCLPLIVLYTLLKRKPEKISPFLSVYGFFGSIIWIYYIANNIVALLQCLGIILGLDEAILGLTIFAIANSIGDLITNLSISKMGFPAMAVGACYGSPMLNILLGIGLSCTYKIYSQEFQNYIIVVHRSVYFSGVGILIGLVYSLVVISASGFSVGNGWFGISLILGYIGLVGFNLAAFMGLF